MTETVQANIAEALRDSAVPIEALNAHPENYRQGDVEAIQASLARFGQVRPVVVQQSTMNVVAGNHTLKAAAGLGWAEIAAVLVDMPDAEAEAYLVADNRTSDKATNDDAALVAILQRLSLAGQLDGTAWTPDEVDDKLAVMNALPEVDPGETEAQAGASGEDVRRTFQNVNTAGAGRQFVLLYTQEIGAEIEENVRKLNRAWGMSGMRDCVKHALQMAVDGLGAEADLGDEPGEAA